MQCSRRPGQLYRSVLGVAGIRISGSNDTCFAVEVKRYTSIRLLGNDYNSSRGIIDVSIYGNEGDISVKGTPGIDYYKLKFYIKGDYVYMVIPTGMSPAFITTGIFQITTLPGDATELTVTSY